MTHDNAYFCYDRYDCLPPEKGGVGKKIAWAVGHHAGYPAATGAKLRGVGTARTPASEPPMVVQQLGPEKNRGIVCFKFVGI
jgi:hypothetical protein